MVKRNYKKKQLGAVQVKPTFTADRFFVYLVGGLATLTGLYVIWTFIKRGLEEKTGDSNLLDNRNVKMANTSSLNYSFDSSQGYQEGLSKEEMIRVQNYLMQKGYNLGNSVATGIAGPRTFQAVRSEGYNSARELLNNL